jgi:hypothetical protein
MFEGIVIIISLCILISLPTIDRRLRNHRKVKQLEQLLDSELPALDCIINNKRYLGCNSTVIRTYRYAAVYTRTQYAPPHASQLCQTKNGSWFLFDPETREVQVCDEAKAKQMLSDDLALYTRTFSAPELA